jgi:hypothetical protein
VKSSAVSSFAEDLSDCEILSAAKMLTKDEARRIAANVAKLLEPLGRGGHAIGKCG